MKKKRHNGKRTTHGSVPPANMAPQEQTANTKPDQPQFDPAMVEHLRVATSQIEGRKVTREEIIEMLERTMRQRSMAPEQKPGYSEGDVTQPPP